MTEEKGEFKDFTDDKTVKQYENKVVFLYKSKKAKHLFAFDYNGAFQSAIDGSILINISDVEALIADKIKSIKVSIMPHQEETEDAAKSG